MFALDCWLWFLRIYLLTMLLTLWVLRVGGNNPLGGKLCPIALELGI